MRKKLWIVTELFYPEETSTAYILTKVALKLKEKYDIKILTGPTSYDLSKKSSTQKLFEAGDLDISRVFVPNLNKNNLFQRVVKFIYLSLALFIKLIFRLKKEDKVLIVTNPAPLILLISLLRIFKKFELIILVHDIFPENLLAANIVKSSNSLTYKITKAIFDRAYRRADKLIVLGRDMAKVVEHKLGTNRKTEIVIIENWGDTHSIIPSTRPNDKEIVRLQYSGNLGRVQGLHKLIEVFSSSKNPNIVMDFYGTGSVESELKDLVAKNEISNIYFHGAYARSEQNRIFQNCDIAIISLSDNMLGLGVPSKSYNILAAGLPILYIGDAESEIFKVVKENNIGFCFDTSDIIGLTNFFDKIKYNRSLIDMGVRAREVCETKYSEEIILSKFYNTL